MHKFKRFKISDLFFIDTGRDIIIGQTESGEYPLISHQHSNNGITKYIKKINNRKLFSYKQTIALADRGVFFATTQCTDFYIGTRVKALTFKYGEINEKIRLYFVTAINKLQCMFEEYLENATDKLPDLIIEVPITEQGKIDFEYMEEVIRKAEKDYINHLKSENDKQLKQNMKEFDINNYGLTDAEQQALVSYLNDTKFRLFKMKDLFTSQNGDVDIQKKDIDNEGIFVVSSGTKDSGVIGKTSKKAKIIKKGCITVDMFGNSYYRDFDFKMVTHARVFAIEYIEKSLSREEGIFFCTSLKFLKEKYSYSNMASWEKIKNEEIRLPIDNKGNINYELIKNFINAQEKLLLDSIYQLSNEKIENLKKIIEEG